MARPDPLAAIDLNLWVLFRALDDERNVHRAARAVGLSPSAASHALSRLRELVGDELFVRVGARMVPTPRAEALAGPVRRALAELSSALAPSASFDPGSASGTFRLAPVDLAQALLVPELLVRVAREAPGVQVLVTSLPERPGRALGDGTLDLALGGVGDEPGLAREELLADGFACVVRADHPVLAAPWTAERYAALHHVVVNPRGVARGHADRALADRGLRRVVACVTPTLELAAQLVARSDLVLTTVERGARAAAARHGLVVLAPPVPIDPYPLLAVWHERRGDDPLLAWVLAALRDIVHRIERPT